MYETRPESPPLGRTASTTSIEETLAGQTIHDLFRTEGDDRPTTANKHRLSYDLNQMPPLHFSDSPLHRTKQPKTSAPAELSPVRASPQGPAGWMQTLSKRKVESHKEEAAAPSAANAVDAMDSKPPVGWEPSLTVVTAAFRLRKLQKARAE